MELTSLSGNRLLVVVGSILSISW